MKFMESSLSSYADNLAERLHNSKCRDFKSYLKYSKIKDGLFLFSYSNCDKNYEKEINEDLAKRFANIYKFYYGDIDKFYLMLTKGVYFCKYKDSWQRFNDKGYIFEVDDEHSKTLHDSHNELAFFPKRKKVKRYNKIKCNLYDNEKFVVNIKVLEQNPNRELEF